MSRKPPSATSNIKPMFVPGIDTSSLNLGHNSSEIEFISKMLTSDNLVEEALLLVRVDVDEVAGGERQQRCQTGQQEPHLNELKMKSG